MTIRMIKLFISQPMTGIPLDEVFKRRQELRNKAEKILGEMVTVVDSFVAFPNPNLPPVYYLGKAVSKMAEADYIIFDENWEQSFGCRIERQVAENYGIRMVV